MKLQDAVCYFALLATWLMGSYHASHSAYWGDIWAMSAIPTMWMATFSVYFVVGLRSTKSERSFLRETAIMALVLIGVFVSTTAVQRVRVPNEDLEMLLFVVATALLLPSFVSGMTGYLLGRSFLRKATPSETA